MNNDSLKCIVLLSVAQYRAGVRVRTVPGVRGGDERRRVRQRVGLARLLPLRQPAHSRPRACTPLPTPLADALFYRYTTPIKYV